MDPKSIFGGIALVIGVISYVPYVKGIVSKKIRPHTFSWLIWSGLLITAFTAQNSDSGGAGAWVTGFSGFACIMIFLVSLKWGDSKFEKMDWISLAFATIAIGLWKFTSDPRLSLILLCLADAFGFIPTFYKSYFKPREDQAASWTISSFKWAFAIAALSTYSFTTLLFPAYLLFMNAAYALMLTWRKHQTRRNLKRAAIRISA